jgi:hypothetical protein
MKEIDKNNNNINILGNAWARVGWITCPRVALNTAPGAVESSGLSPYIHTYIISGHSYCTS